MLFGARDEFDWLVMEIGWTIIKDYYFLKYGNDIEKAYFSIWVSSVLDINSEHLILRWECYSRVWRNIGFSNAVLYTNGQQSLDRSVRWVVLRTVFNGLFLINWSKIVLVHYNCSLHYDRVRLCNCGFLKGD